MFMLSFICFAEQPLVTVPKAATILKQSYLVNQKFYVTADQKTYVAVATTTANTTFSACIVAGTIVQFTPEDVYYTVVTVPVANLDSLHLGYSLIAAPGTGKYIDLISASVLVTVNGSGAWDVGSQTMYIGWGTTAATVYKYNVSNAVVENASGTLLHSPVPLAVNPISNKPLVISLSGTTKPTGGYHPVMKVVLFYRIVSQ